MKVLNLISLTVLLLISLVDADPIPQKTIEQVQKIRNLCVNTYNKEKAKNPHVEQTKDYKTSRKNCCDAINKILKPYSLDEMSESLPNDLELYVQHCVNKK